MSETEEERQAIEELKARIGAIEAETQQERAAMSALIAKAEKTLVMSEAIGAGLEAGLAALSPEQAEIFKTAAAATIAEVRAATTTETIAN